MDPKDPGKPIAYISKNPSLRDKFAIMAMDGAFRCDPTHFYLTTDEDRMGLCRKAYVWADTMMKVRGEE